MEVKEHDTEFQNQVRKKIEDLLNAILSQLLQDSNSTKVKVIVHEHTTIFFIDTDQKNIGQIIGTRGKNITSLRTIVNSIAGRNNIRAIVEIPFFTKASGKNGKD